MLDTLVRLTCDGPDCEEFTDVRPSELFPTTLALPGGWTEVQVSAAGFAQPRHLHFCPGSCRTDWFERHARGAAEAV